MSEIEALQRYADHGDADAFRTLVHRYQRLVYAACRRHLRDEADVEDATQETFLRLARHAREVQTSVASWLHRCAVNASLDIVRRDGTRRRHEAAAARPEGQDLTWAELSREVDAAVAELDEADRELILSYFYESATQAELAAEQGVSQATMNRRIAAAVERLRGALTKCGVTGAAGVITSLLTADAASAQVPAALTAGLAKVGLAASGTAAATAGTTKLAAIAAAIVLTAGVIGVVLMADRAAAPPTVTQPPVAASPAVTVPQRTLGRMDPRLLNTRWRGTLMRDGQTSAAWLGTSVGDYYLVNEATDEAWFGELATPNFDEAAASNVATLTLQNPDAPAPHATAEARYNFDGQTLRMAVAPPGQPAPADATPGTAPAAGVRYFQLQPTRETLLHIRPFADTNPDFGGYSYNVGQDHAQFSGVGLAQMLARLHGVDSQARVRDVVGVLNDPTNYVGAVFSDDLRGTMAAWVQEQAPLRAQKVERVVPVYRLTREGEATMTMQPSESEFGWSRRGDADGYEVWDGFTTAALATELEGRLKRPVFDETGIQGRFKLRVPFDVLYHRSDGWRTAFEPFGLKVVPDERAVEMLELLPADPQVDTRTWMQGPWIDGDDVIRVEGDRVTMTAPGMEVFAATILDVTPEPDDAFAGRLRLRVESAPRPEMRGQVSLGLFRFDNGGLKLAWARPGLPQYPADFQGSKQVNEMELRRLGYHVETPPELRGRWRSQSGAVVEVTATELRVDHHRRTRRLRLVGLSRNSAVEWIEMDADLGDGADAPIRPERLIRGYLDERDGKLQLSLGDPGDERGRPGGEVGISYELMREVP